MNYTAYKPVSPVGDYIDSYWVIRSGDRSGQLSKSIFPDGGTEIVVNGGHGIAYLNGNIPLYPRLMYFRGTKTFSGNLHINPGMTLISIRFRPGAVDAFYDLPVGCLVDGITEFTDPDLGALTVPDQPGVGITNDALFHRLDQYFIRRFMPGRDGIQAMIREVYLAKGRITVDDLSRQFHISTRTLQRAFKTVLGISPREFIKITRFQQVLKKLQESTPRESLLRIAFETGYYDHAHLTHDFKRYAGLNPVDIREEELGPV